MHSPSAEATTSFSGRYYLLFLLLALALRWGSFFPSVIDSDESTYIVLADELLRGEVYLRDLVDTKPIGIVWIYAALIKLTGGSIFLLRTAAALVVGLGAWLLYLTVRRVTGSVAGGYVAGVTYCFMTSVYKYYGVSPNTEIYFNVCTIAAVAVSVAPPAGRQWFVGGLLLGTGFIIKPFVVAECVAVGLYLIYHYRCEPLLMLRKGLTLVAGFVLPVAIMVGYFAYYDLLAELWFYGVEVGRAYPIEMPWYLRLKYMGDYLLRYSPLIVLGVVAQLRSRGSGVAWQWQAFLGLAFFLVCAVVMLTGKRFGHYQIQLHPLVSLYVGTYVGAAYGRGWIKGWWTTALLVVALGLGTVQYFYYSRKTDQPRIVADYLRSRLGPGETFLVINGYQIVYHLLDRSVPTPYVHRHLLFETVHQDAFRIDQEQEVARILQDSSLRYLIGTVGDPALEEGAAHQLLTGFVATDTLSGTVVVYHRSHAVRE